MEAAPLAEIEYRQWALTGVPQSHIAFRKCPETSYLNSMHLFPVEIEYVEYLFSAEVGVGRLPPRLSVAGGSETAPTGRRRLTSALCTL